MRGKGLSIAIDGPSGAGKTTVSRALAKRLGFCYVDTGAMYRAVAVAASRAGIDLDSDAALCDFLKDAAVHYEADRVFFNGEDLTHLIREPHVGVVTSRVSGLGSVRAKLVPIQRALAAAGSVVMEGRDIGTVVLADADVKFFLDAPEDVRARRRHMELDKGAGVAEDAVRTGISERDARDSARANSPLRMAADAVRMDTASLGVDEVVERMLSLIKERFGPRPDGR